MDGNTRTGWIDTARGIAMLSIILMHCQPPKAVAYFLAAYSVQMFFILSGCLFRAGETTFRSFALKKAKRLLIPYACLGLIIVVFQSVKDYFLDRRGFPILDYLKALLLQRGYTSLWFLPCLFIAGLLFWLILRLTKGSLLYSGLISAGLCCAAFVYYRTGGVTLPWCVDVSLPAVFYLWAGCALRGSGMMSRLEALPATVRALLAALLLAVCAGAAWLSVEITGAAVSMVYGQYQNEALTTLAAVAGSLGWMLLSTVISGRYLTYLGRNTMVYFAFNQAIVYMTLSWVLSRFGWGLTGGLSQLLRALLCFAVILAVLYPVERFLIKRCPIAVNGLR